MAKMLISKFINEDQNKIKLICRASNIAHWFNQNFANHAGTLMSLRDVRSSILDGLGNPSTGSGDLRVHGRAAKLLGLNLETISNENYVEFSLINLKRCASFLLGSGRISGGLTLLKKPTVSADQAESDVDLIDQAMLLDSDKLTTFERIFTKNLNKKYRTRKLSMPQRVKLLQIINERD